MPHNKIPLTRLADLSGKTIAEGGAYLSVSGALILRFEDSTFAAFTALDGEEELGDDGCVVVFCHRPQAYDLYSAGVLTDEEYKAECAEETAARDKRERAFYERLKAKFEGEQS